VLLALEYELYNSGKMTPAWRTRCRGLYRVARSSLVRSLSLREQWSVFMLTRHPVWSASERAAGGHRPSGDPGVYSVRSINEQGDQINHSAARPAKRDQICR